MDGAINSISFTYNETKNPALNETNNSGQDDIVTAEHYPESSTLDSLPFVVDDFSVSTHRAQYLYMKTEGSDIKVCVNKYSFFMILEFLDFFFVNKSFPASINVLK